MQRQAKPTPQNDVYKQWHVCVCVCARSINRSIKLLLLLPNILTFVCFHHTSEQIVENMKKKEFKLPPMWGKKVHEKKDIR